jgi:hypothetical protein
MRVPAYFERYSSGNGKAVKRFSDAVEELE